MLLPLLVALATPPAGTLVVLNKSEATASLIDLATGQTVATVATGEAPHEAAVSPDGRRAVATNYGTRPRPGSSLTVIDVAEARALKTIALPSCPRPHGVRFLDGRRLALTCEGARTLAVVDVDTGTIAAEVPTTQEVSHMVAVTPDGARAFVANIGSGTVTAVDLGRKVVLAQIPTGKGAEGIELTPDGRELWVTNREADTVAIVDPTSLKVVASLPSASFPIRVAFTPDGRHALVSNARSGDLAVFDRKARREIARVSMKSLARAPEAGEPARLATTLAGGAGPAPVGILVPPGGGVAYVANTNADLVAVVDLETWTVTGTLKAGKEPDGMAYSPLVATPIPPARQ
ncbi:MAG TPA: cytochrome D1 domain-containing protein [Vicinamibacteria bacterium]|nr:cytochrome D1 domain-containing protein [Vicinamibacteria bacterium]